MADEEVKENDESIEEEIKPPSGGKKGMLIIIVGAVMLVVAIFLVVFIIYPKYQELNGQADVTEEAEEEVVDEPVEIGMILKIENITINPKGSMGRRFAIFEIALEYHDPELEPTLKTYMPLILDKYQTYLRGKTVLELSTTAYVDVIRSDLKEIVNDLLKGEKISNLYFTRFVLQ